MATCEYCGQPISGGGFLCDQCLESNEFVVCDVCGTWEVYETLRYNYGEDLGGWCVLSEGPETYCPKHRPADLRSGSWDTCKEAKDKLMNTAGA